MTARGWTFDDSLTDEPIDLAAADAVGLRFTETMHGSIRLDGDRSSRSRSLSRSRWPTSMRSSRSGGPHPLAGTVSASALDEHRLTIDGGTFRLFVDDPTNIDVQHMEYRLPLVAQDGRRWLLVGRKTLRPLLRARLARHHDPRGHAPRGHRRRRPPMGHGTMRLDPVDFTHQLRTMDVIGAKDTAQRLSTVATFGRVFAGDLFDHYGSVVAPRIGLRSATGAAQAAGPRSTRA